MDFNGDGVLDLILGEKDGQYFFYTGNGDGTLHFIGHPYDDEGGLIARPHVSSGHLADWNDDGKLDFIAGGYTNNDTDGSHSGMLHVHLNLHEDPDGMLWDADVIDLSAFWDTWRTTQEMYDLDNDGLKDLILTNRFDGRVYLAPNTGTPGNPVFTSHSVIQTDAGDMNTYLHFGCSGSARENITDYNSDGIPDMLVGCTNGYVLVFIGYYS